MPDPNTMKPEEWEHLASLASEKSQDGYLQFLYLKTNRKQNQQVFHIPILSRSMWLLKSYAKLISILVKKTIAC